MAPKRREESYPAPGEAAKKSKAAKNSDGALLPSKRKKKQPPPPPVVEEDSTESDKEESEEDSPPALPPKDPPAPALGSKQLQVDTAPQKAKDKPSGDDDEESDEADDSEDSDDEEASPVSEQKTVTTPGDFKMAFREKNSLPPEEEEEPDESSEEPVIQRPPPEKPGKTQATSKPNKANEDSDDEAPLPKSNDTSLPTKAVTKKVVEPPLVVKHVKDGEKKTPTKEVVNKVFSNAHKSSTNGKIKNPPPPPEASMVLALGSEVVENGAAAKKKGVENSAVKKNKDKGDLKKQTSVATEKPKKAKSQLAEPLNGSSVEVKGKKSDETQAEKPKKQVENSSAIKSDSAPLQPVMPDPEAKDTKKRRSSLQRSVLGADEGHAAPNVAESRQKKPRVLPTMEPVNHSSSIDVKQLPFLESVIKRITPGQPEKQQIYMHALEFLDESTIAALESGIEKLHNARTQFRNRLMREAQKNLRSVLNARRRGRP